MALLDKVSGELNLYIGGSVLSPYIIAPLGQHSDTAAAFSHYDGGKH